MLDDKLIFSAAQAITGDSDCTNDIDLGALVDDRGTALGKMGPETDGLRLLVTVHTTFAGGTDLQVILEDSTDDSTYVETELKSNNNTVASDMLNANVILLNAPLPKQLSRYLRVIYKVGTGTHTAGKVNARITMGAQSDLTHGPHAIA